MFKLEGKGLVREYKPKSVNAIIRLANRKSINKIQVAVNNIDKKEVQHLIRDLISTREVCVIEFYAKKHNQVIERVVSFNNINIDGVITMTDVDKYINEVPNALISVSGYKYIKGIKRVTPFPHSAKYVFNTFTECDQNLRVIYPTS